MDYEKTSKAIRTARIAAGYTQARVADILGKSQTAVAAWETGRSQPTASVIVELAKLYGVSSDYLLGLSDYFSDTHKAVIEALLGDVQAPRFADEMSRLIAKLPQLSEKIDDKDTFISMTVECLGDTIKEFNALLSTFLDTCNSIELGKKISILNKRVANLSEKSFSAFPQDAKELYYHFIEFETSVKAFDPATFSGNALICIDQIEGSFGKLALFLQNKLSGIYSEAFTSSEQG